MYSSITINPSSQNMFLLQEIEIQKTLPRIKKGFLSVYLSYYYS
jgi:hypothetical protein